METCVKFNDHFKPYDLEAKSLYAQMEKHKTVLSFLLCRTSDGNVGVNILTTKVGGEGFGYWHRRKKKLLGLLGKSRNLSKRRPSFTVEEKDLEVSYRKSDKYNRLGYCLRRR